MNTLKRLFVLMALITLFLFSSGCGGKKSETQEALISQAKETVFQMQPFDISSLLGNGENYSINQFIKRDDKIYALIFQNDITDGAPQLFSMSTDGSNMLSVELQLWKDGISPNADKVKNNPEIMSEYISISNLSADPARTFYALKEYSFYDYTDSDNLKYLSERYLCAWNENGRMLWETKLEIEQDNSDLYLRVICPKKDGGAVLLFSGEQPAKMSIDQNGNAGKMQLLENEFRSILQNCNTAIPDSNGGVYLIYNSTETFDKNYISHYDAAADSLGEQKELPSDIAWSGLYHAVCEGTDNLYYANSEGVCHYHIGDTEAKQIMSFINSDLSIESVNTVLPVDAEHFIAEFDEMDPDTYISKPVIALFTKVKPEDVPDKKELVLGGTDINWQLRRRVVDFNKANNEYRIIIKNYGTDGTYENPDAGLTHLNLDITTGNMPDILVLNNPFELQNYASKGLLADIGKLLSQDKELSGNEYLNNVFEACKINGVLYEIIPEFCIHTYVGKKSIVGDRNKWTMTEAQNTLNSMPQGTTLFGETVKSSYLSEMLCYCGRNFIDTSTGKCNFENEEFMAMLEYANQLPDEIDYSSVDDTNYWTEEQMRYREEKSILAEYYFSFVSLYRDAKYGQFVDDIRFVGFPGTGGSGSVLRTDTTYALSAKSKNINIAWDFMKYYLTPEYQNSLEYALPVLKETLNAMLQKTMEKSYYLDEDNNKIEYDDSYWIGDTEFALPVLTKEETTEISDFIQSVNTRNFQNETILDIITEEAAPYFAGQKDIRTVASLIQNRVQLYINENS